MKETIELTKIFLKSSISSMDEKMGVKRKAKGQINIIHFISTLFCRTRFIF